MSLSPKPMRSAAWTAEANGTASTLVSEAPPPISLERVAHLPPAQPGRVIADIYRVIGSLGTGSMGMVLLARDEKLDRRVAIKFIRGDLLDAAFRARFTDEARAMARVNHPNVLHVYAFGEHEGVPYFVMEFVDGTTLEQWLARMPSPIDIEIALRILDETCDGVSAIHAADTVHRDLKPGNILLDTKLKPRIADMGLAILRRDDGVRKPEIAGTPAYMAPEIAFGREIEPWHRVRADVYSLACVAYELLTGRAPFQAETQVALMLKHASVPVPPPSSVRPALPPEVDDAILRAMAKNPTERTPTVDVFRRELMATLEKSPDPERILVGEADAESREAIRIHLELKFPDAQVDCFADGVGVVAAFARTIPTVVVLDLCMSGLDGFQVTEWIRAQEESKRIPIIILTASGGPEQWKRLAALGADGFLVKPVSLDDVVALVRRSLRERISGVFSRSQVPSTRLPG